MKAVDNTYSIFSIFVELKSQTFLVPVVAGLVADGLLDAGAAMKRRAALTLRGRLMADTVTRALAQ